MIIFSIFMSFFIGACCGVMFTKDEEVKQALQGLKVEDLGKKARITLVSLMIVYFIVWIIWYLR